MISNRIIMQGYKTILRSLLPILVLVATSGLMAQVSLPQNISKIPANKKIVITYDVMVNEDVPTNATQVCEQAQITYNNPNADGVLFFKSDDPSVDINAEDPTYTDLQPVVVPTMNQWALILFALVVLNLGLIFLNSSTTKKGAIY